MYTGDRDASYVARLFGGHLDEPLPRTGSTRCTSVLPYPCPLFKRANAGGWACGWGPQSANDRCYCDVQYVRPVRINHQGKHQGGSCTCAWCQAGFCCRSILMKLRDTKRDTGRDAPPVCAPPTCRSDRRRGGGGRWGLALFAVIYYRPRTTALQSGAPTAIIWTIKLDFVRPSSSRRTRKIDIGQRPRWIHGGTPTSIHVRLLGATTALQHKSGILFGGTT